jgi:hypothetical protein
MKYPMVTRAPAPAHQRHTIRRADTSCHRPRAAGVERECAGHTFNRPFGQPLLVDRHQHVGKRLEKLGGQLGPGERGQRTADSLIDLPGKRLPARTVPGQRDAEPAPLLRAATCQLVGDRARLIERPRPHAAVDHGQQSFVAQGADDLQLGGLLGLLDQRARAERVVAGDRRGPDDERLDLPLARSGTPGGGEDRLGPELSPPALATQCHFGRHPELGAVVQGQAAVQLLEASSGQVVVAVDADDDRSLGPGVLVDRHAAIGPPHRPFHELRRDRPIPVPGRRSPGGKQCRSAVLRGRQRVCPGRDRVDPRPSNFRVAASGGSFGRPSPGQASRAGGQAADDPAGPVVLPERRAGDGQFGEAVVGQERGEGAGESFGLDSQRGRAVAIVRYDRAGGQIDQHGGAFRGIEEGAGDRDGTVVIARAVESAGYLAQSPLPLLS